MNKTDIFSDLRAGEELYAAASDHPEVTEALNHCADTCHRINALQPTDTETRARFLRGLLGSYGEKFDIKIPFRCDFGFNIHLGENFMANFGLTVLDEAEVRIGRNVMIGPNCSIITITHSLDHKERALGLMRALPVTIGDDVWIAANVTVLPGVSIGARSVIGAGSVVTKDIPADVVAAGNPAKVIKVIPKAE